MLKICIWPGSGSSLAKMFHGPNRKPLPGIVRKRKRAFKPDAPNPNRSIARLIERKPNASGQLTFDALAWRAICNVEPEKHWTKLDEGEVVARMAQIGDKFALRYELSE